MFLLRVLFEHSMKKMKIYNFFVRVPHNEVAAAKAKIFSESENAQKVKKEEEQKKQQEVAAKKKRKEEEELLEKKRKLEMPYLLGKRVFDSADEDKKIILENHMFGDLASMVEFYNTFSSIYDNKSHFKYVPKRDKIEFTKIKFEDMVNMLNANMETPQSRKYYCKLIESLLRILLKYESIYEVLTAPLELLLKY